MPAKLDRPLIDGLVGSFPAGPKWQSWHCSECIRDNGENLLARWGSLAHVHQQGGVYVFTLPASLFPKTCVIQLHPPHSHKGVKIPFEFTVNPQIGSDGWSVVYVGRTIDLKRRFRGHLLSGGRNDGGQVKYGLIDCGVCSGDEKSALRMLRANGRIIYTVLTGPDQCANRDLLEMSLCARFAPPFNIKSER